MFCVKCGAQLHDGAKFCANCGAVIGRIGASATPIDNTPKLEIPKVENPKVETPKVETPVVEIPKVEEPIKIEAEQPAESVAEEQPKAPANDTASDTETAAVPPEPKKKKKKAGKVIAIIAIILAAVMLLGVLAGAVCYFAFFRSDLNEYEANYAYVDSNGKGYLCYDDGKVIELGKNISSACMSPDKKKIVVVGTDGLVYWTDAKLSEKNEITDLNLNNDDQCWISIYYITDDFIVFSVDDKRASLMETSIVYRYAFDDDKLIELVTETVNKKYADESTKIKYEIGYSKYVNDIAFVKADNGQIRVLRPDSNKFEKIATYNTNSEISFCGVSNDGNTVSWMELNDSGYTVMVYTDENVEKVASGVVTKNTTPYFNMWSDPNNEVFVILGDNKAIFLKDGNIEDVTFSGTVRSYADVYTTNGVALSEDKKAGSALGCYIGVEVSDGSACDVYVVDFDGTDKMRLVSGVSAWVAVKGKLLYLDTNDVLYIADVDLDELKLVDRNKIDTGVFNIAFSETAPDHIYYIINCNEKDYSGDLYVYNVKEDDGEKIDSGVNALYFEVSKDGRYVYYFTSVKKDQNNYIEYGDFNVYDARSDEDEEIDDDVIISSVWSTLACGEYDSKCIWYEQHSGASGNGYKYDVCFYNGKETTVVVDGMISK